jgi:peptidoglycan/xylan/chitin deacetylase (PgdA/CDA1 family)
LRRPHAVPLALCASALTLSALTLGACASPTGGDWNAGEPVPVAAAQSDAARPTPTPHRAIPGEQGLGDAPKPTRSATPKPSKQPTTPTTPTPEAVTATARGPIDAPGPAGSVRGTGSSAVALTFDDGPDPVNTPKLLDVLKAHGVRATFCLVGHRARDNQALVARIAAEGHTLCNHSWQHLQDLSDRPDAYLNSDIRNTNTEITRAVPGYVVRYFRAPFGNFTPRVNEVAAKYGMTPIYWDVDDESYLTAEYGKGPAMVDHIVRTVQVNVRPGSIVLGHDNLKPFTATAYARLLPWLKARHRLVALPD